MKLYRYTSYFLVEKGVCKDVISDVYLYLWQNRKQLPEIQNYGYQAEAQSLLIFPHQQAR